MIYRIYFWLIFFYVLGVIGALVLSNWATGKDTWENPSIFSIIIYLIFTWYWFYNIKKKAKALEEAFKSKKNPEK